MSPPAPLARTAFTTSRSLDYCSERELTKQIGYEPFLWPLVILKELVDNGLDAAEEAGVAPVITVDVSHLIFTVRDNGPGISPETIASILDFRTRTSSREAYVSPTRGSQGNGLKTLLAMGFALDGTVGRTKIESRGVAHHIVFRADPIRQQPLIEHDQSSSEVKSGTRITVTLPLCACSKMELVKSRFLLLASSFACFNPHLSLKVEWGFEHVVSAAASDSAWAKWRPSDPTSAYWYDETRLRRLMGAYIADDEDHGREPRFVRDFLHEFRGLSGSAKKATVLEAAGATRVTLPELFSTGSPASLLVAMQEATRPVQAKDLGVIGADHLAARFEAMGADPETFTYKRIFGESGGLPYVIEAAFGYRPSGQRRVISTGANWSPAIIDPFRQIGHESLDAILAEQHAGVGEPIAFALHLACPRVSFTDHGKGAIALDAAQCDDIRSAIVAVTKAWARQRKSEKRNAAAEANRHDRLVGTEARITVASAAAEIMREAYLAASANGTLPASARQIMYQARGHIQDRTGKQLSDAYFTQKVLPDYLTEHGLELSWDVVFDDRGSFIEPHTRRKVGLGTLAVRSYLAGVDQPLLEEVGIARARVTTQGPAGRFSAALFVEKEGFTPLFEAVRLAEKFDLAIMSTKGMSVTAARRLIDHLGVPIFILHDFDKAGFSIAGTLQRATRRYSFDNEVEVIDLGLRLEDIVDLDLEDKAEDVFDKGDDDSKRQNLRLNGATDDEIEFLLEKRVELNALTSDQLVRLVEEKLEDYGIKKLVPDRAMLDDAYRLFARGRSVKKTVMAALAKQARTADVDVPSDLAEQVEVYLAEHPTEAWDDAVEALLKP
jgi:DNA topoisomerase VI subunit B